MFTPPKTARGRRIPLPAAAVDTLRAHKEGQDLEKLLEPERWQDLDLVFCDSVGRPVRDSQKQKTRDLNLRIAGFGRSCGPVVPKQGLEP
jgi:hypothetical protein